MLESSDIEECINKRQMMQVTPSLQKSIQVTYDNQASQNTRHPTKRIPTPYGNSDAPVNESANYSTVSARKRVANETYEDLLLESVRGTCWLNVTLPPRGQRVALELKQQTCRSHNYVSVHEAFYFQGNISVVSCMTLDSTNLSAVTLHSDRTFMWTGKCRHLGVFKVCDNI
jgi:hypothetical protein